MGFAIARLKGVDARLRGLWTGVYAYELNASYELNDLLRQRLRRL
jgi:hypothetical protein